MTERRARGNLWLLLAILPLVSVSCWFCLREDDSVESSPPPALAPTDVAQPEPTPLEPLTMPDGGLGDGGSDDAGVDGGVDAGQPRRRGEPTDAEIAAYVARWKEALAPVLGSFKPQPPKALLARASELNEVKDPTEKKNETPEVVDAGCQSGQHSLMLAARAPVDIVVAVDTSGSMFVGGLDAAAAFLARLEYRLVEGRVDYQLLVLAEPSQLRLTTDAGVTNAAVASNDGLDVLLRTATQFTPGWLRFIRPEVELRMVLVTDDAPYFRNTAASFIKRIETTFPGKKVNFTVLGGFGPVDRDTVLNPNDPIASNVCTSVDRPALVGVNAGTTYQSVAMQTGGLRGSLCSQLSGARLADVLAGARPTSRCEWPLHPAMRVRNAHAVDFRGAYISLIEEWKYENCGSQRRSYFLRPGGLALCPDTCTELESRRVQDVLIDVDCIP
ncbi:MAG: hypothetical protein QM817_31180 [Archangium sp.]